MSLDGYRYTFDPKVPITEVRYSILLSALAAEGVHGRAQVLLDAEFLVDEEARTCTVDSTTPVGRTISQIFTGLLTREFGEAAFSAQRLVEISGTDSAQAGSASSETNGARGKPVEGVSRTNVQPLVSSRRGPADRNTGPRG